MLIRHHLPLNTNIRQLKDGDIDGSLDRVKAGFEIDLDQQHVKEAAVSILKDRNRSMRFKLHLLFKTFPSHEAAISNPPKGVDTKKWEEMCQYWTSDKFILGDPMDGFKETHMKKNGEWLTEEDRAAYVEMDEKLKADCPEYDVDPTSVDIEQKKKVCSVALGKKSHKLLGFVPEGSSSGAKNSARDQEIVTELEVSRAKNQELQNLIEELNQEREEMKKQKEELDREREELKRQKEEHDNRIGGLETFVGALKNIPEISSYLRSYRPSEK